MDRLIVKMVSGFVKNVLKNMKLLNKILSTLLLLGIIILAVLNMFGILSVFALKIIQVVCGGGGVVVGMLFSICLIMYAIWKD